MNLKEVLKSNEFIVKSYTNLMYEKFMLSVWLSKFNKFYKNSSLRMKSLENSNLGKRCFIIGNGPSLTTNDLDKLKNEYTFATNMIFKIFDETEWRPTYYVAQDYLALKQLYANKENMNKLNLSEVFLPTDVTNVNIKHSDNIIYFYIHRKNPFPGMPKFSSDAPRVVFEGGTVTYTAIQLAAYMGFNEIYLLGVDHNYSKIINLKGEIINDNTVKDYFSKDYNTMQNSNPVNLALPELAFNSARKYCEDNNIKIYNATRGGNLDIFDRINFDKLKFGVK